MYVHNILINNTIINRLTIILWACIGNTVSSLFFISFRDDPIMLLATSKSLKGNVCVEFEMFKSELDTALDGGI